MSKRKFNLGEIIRKLNEDQPSSQNPAHADAPDHQPTPAEKSMPARPAPPHPVTSSPDLPDEFPRQPDYYSRTGIGREQQTTMEKPHREVSHHRETGSISSAPSAGSGFGAPDHQRTAAPATVLPQQHAPAPVPPPKPSPTPPSPAAEDEEDEEEFDIIKYVGILLRRKYIVLIVILLSSLLSLFRYSKSATYYVASARLLFRPDNQEMLNVNQVFRFWGDREKIFSTHLELLKSRTVLTIVAENLQNLVTPEAIAASLTIKQGETNGEKNDIIELTFRNSNAEIARDVLNELCRSYIDYRRDVNAQEVTRLIKKLEFQIDKLEGELDQRESALREFKESHRMVELSNETNLTISKLGTMEMALQQTQLELLENKERLGALATQISKQEQDIVQSVTYQDPFKDKISELELELSSLTTEYSPEHFKVKSLRQQIENLKSAAIDSLTKKAASRTLVKNPIRQTLLQDLVNATIEKSSLDAKRVAQEQMINRLNQELIKLPAMEQQYANLQRETESLLQTLRVLKSKYEEVKIRRDSEESDLKLLELAQTPRTPHSTSRPSSILIGILIGIILGIGLALLIEYLDQSLKDPSAVEKVLGLPLLGIVPFIEADRALLEHETDLTKNILEPFRALRANLKHLATTHNLQTFIICSAIKGEGKTTLGANLAITFAMDGKKVILVDGDLRRSQVHTLFGIPKALGLSDYLLGNTHVEEIIKPTHINNMFLITSGERPHNPAELLGTIRFDQLITELRHQADIIIFDSPALLPVSDTITMAPKMDGVLFVVRSFWTPLKAAKQALNQLERIGSKLFGGILNGASHSGKHYPYYYGYYGYYGYYSYKYAYEDDQKQRWSVRSAGLVIEKKVKELVTSSLLGLPKIIGMIGRETSRLTRRKRFWTLFLLLIAITGIRVYLQDHQRQTLPETIEYVGVSSNPAAASPAPPVNDIAFTAKDPSAISDNAEDDDTTGLQAAVNGWYSALSAGNMKAYGTWYNKKSFRSDLGGLVQWEERKSAEFSADSGTIYGPLTSLRVISSNRTRTEIFVSYQTTTNSVTADHRVVLIWTRSEGPWLITEEKELYETNSGKKGE